jgi:hypothetical protein
MKRGSAIADPRHLEVKGLILRKDEDKMTVFALMVHLPQTRKLYRGQFSCDKFLKQAENFTWSDAKGQDANDVCVPVLISGYIYVLVSIPKIVLASSDDATSRPNSRAKRTTLATSSALLFALMPLE